MTTHPRDDLAAMRLVAPALVVGVASVAAGGMLAAVTASAPSQPTTWACAYLVLVAGLSQLGLGIGQALLAPRPMPRRQLLAQFIAWNVGNALVLVGTLIHTTALVDIGGILLVLALVLAVALTRGERRRPTWILPLFRVLVVVLAVSVPIGVLLARLGG